MMNSFITAILITTITLYSGNVFSAKLKYGYIKNIFGNVPLYLIRKNKKVLVEKGMDILIGDKLISKSKNITIEYCNNKGICNTTNKEKIFLFDSNKVNSNIGHTNELNLRIWDRTKDYVVQAVSRAGENDNREDFSPVVYLAGMTEVLQDLFSGKRSFIFQWKHGTPPFNIEITQFKKIIFKSKTEQQDIKTKKIDWKQGEYQIIIKDSSDRMETILFNVIKEPLFTQQLSTFLDNNENKNDNIKDYTRLGTLAMVDGGRYALEAYQQLLLISMDTPILMYLQKAIEAGEEFPELKSTEVIRSTIQ